MNCERSKGPGIDIVKGVTIGFWCCAWALKQNTDCKCAVCVECHPKLLREHGLEEAPVRDREWRRSYKFPGCANHSYKELDLVPNEDGAYWCDPGWKDYDRETRPIGCILCLRPFKFHASNKTIRKKD